jgi:hypothetical protein
MNPPTNPITAILIPTAKPIIVALSIGAVGALVAVKTPVFVFPTVFVVPPFGLGATVAPVFVFPPMGFTAVVPVGFGAAVPVAAVPVGFGAVVPVVVVPVGFGAAVPVPVLPKLFAMGFTFNVGLATLNPAQFKAVQVLLIRVTIKLNIFVCGSGDGTVAMAALIACSLGKACAPKFAQTVIVNAVGSFSVFAGV